jgi:hypothetical protein
MTSSEMYVNNSRQDIFGFYRVGDLKMYSQIEAVELSQRLNRTITWHFNDEVYGSFDWTKEPEESISELYKRRCEQLREKYDYLVLYYSAGADSDNILNFFVENNIRLDEVVSYVNYEGTQDKLSQFNAEIFEVAIPKIKKIQEKQPHLKHTLIDTTKLVLEKYSSLNLDQIYNQNVSFAPFTSVKEDFKMSQEHWRKMFSDGKKVGFISGVDKPKVIIDDERKFRYFFSCPGIAAAVSPTMQHRNNPWEFDELFYWSPDFPKIPIKQAHIIKNFFKQNGIEKFKKSPRMLGSAIKQPPIGVFVLIQGENYLQNEDLNKLVYPYWYNIPHQYKALNMIIYDKEMWFIGKMNSEEQAKNWKIITQKVLEITKTDYRKQSFFNNAIHSSKPYFLGE